MKIYENTTAFKVSIDVSNSFLYEDTNSWLRNIVNKRTEEALEDLQNDLILIFREFSSGASNGNDSKIRFKVKVEEIDVMI